jgi:hypothetical protein
MSFIEMGYSPGVAVVCSIGKEDIDLLSLPFFTYWRQARASLLVLGIALIARCENAYLWPPAIEWSADL